MICVEERRIARPRLGRCRDDLDPGRRDQPLTPGQEPAILQKAGRTNASVLCTEHKPAVLGEVQA